MADVTTQIRMLATAMQVNVPTIIWGPPGIAKSRMIEALAKAMDWPIEIILSAVRDPTDFGGFPVDTANGMVMKAPAWARRLTERELKGRSAVLFLEEINQCPPSVQAALMRVVHEGWVGEEKLADTVVRVAAANPPECSAGGWTLAAPLANRFFHIDWALPAQFWCEGMLTGFAPPQVERVPSDWVKHMPAARSDVASFIYKNPSELHKLPENEDKAGRAWPSPRSWDHASRLLAACYALSYKDDMQLQIVAGMVGEGAAFAFMEYKRELNLPDPRQVLRDPGNFKWPERPDRMYAILASVTAHVLAGKNTKDWEQAWLVLESAGKKMPDVCASHAKALAQAWPEDGKMPETAYVLYEPMRLAKKIRNR